MFECLGDRIVAGGKGFQEKLGSPKNFPSLKTARSSSSSREFAVGKSRLLLIPSMVQVVGEKSGCMDFGGLQNKQAVRNESFRTTFWGWKLASWRGCAIDTQRTFLL